MINKIPQAILNQIEGKKIIIFNNNNTYVGVAVASYEHGSLLVLSTGTSQVFIDIKPGWSIEIGPEHNPSNSRIESRNDLLEIKAPDDLSDLVDDYDDEESTPWD